MSKVNTKAAIHKPAVNIPHISKNRVLSILVVVLWVITSILAISAFAKPAVLADRVTINEIEEKTAFDYTGIMKKSTLYPEGGHAEDQVLFNKLTEKLIIKLSSVINTKAPVKVEGNIRVTYSLAAKGMWEREFVLVDTKQINLEGTSGSLMQEEFEFDLAELRGFIKKIEEETDVARGDYMLIIKPRILGLVFQQNGEKIHEINNSMELPFELNSQYVKYAAESPERVLTNIKPIERTQTAAQSINILGVKIPVTLARWIFSILSAACILAVFLLGSRQIVNKVFNEVEAIDKKYRNKIMEIADDIGDGYSAKLGLKCFKDLQRISDEKDEPILKYTDTIKGIAFYYVAGSSNVYYYAAMLP